MCNALYRAVVYVICWRVSNFDDNDIYAFKPISKILIDLKIIITIVKTTVNINNISVIVINTNKHTDNRKINTQIIEKNTTKLLFPFFLYKSTRKRKKERKNNGTKQINNSQNY